VGCYFLRGRFPCAKSHSVAVLLVEVLQNAKSLGLLEAGEVAGEEDVNEPVHNKAA
jgi:hypothetical protein